MTKDVVVGTVVESTGGTNVGMRDCVEKICDKMHVFKIGNKKKRVSKKHAAAIAHVVVHEVEATVQHPTKKRAHRTFDCHF